MAATRLAANASIALSETFLRLFIFTPTVLTQGMSFHTPYPESSPPSNIEFDV
jgi:hypothetical protein